MDIIEICRETIKDDFPEVIGVWLFGSFARHESLTAESDIDLAVLLPQKADALRLWQCAQRIASKMVTREVDLIDLIDASTVLRAQIMQDGKLIYCADKYKCDLFETEALTDYLRFSEERKDLLEDIRMRGKVLGNG
jgi:uncharacterized protein